MRLFLSLLALSGPVIASQYHDGPSSILRRAMTQDSNHTLDVSTCPGYKVESVSNTPNGLKADLKIGGASCNAFGKDVLELTLEVTYEAKSRLHVHIYDTLKQQYQIPASVFPVIGAAEDGTAGAAQSDLEFGFDQSPFAFWVIRKSDKEIIFDTRGSNLSPVGGGEEGVANTTSLGSFPLVFENQYLQIASSVPKNANIYGLGEYVASSGFRRDPDATVQTIWARDAGNPVDENEYGSHAVHFEHRIKGDSSSTHGIFLKNSHGMDVILRSGAVEYRAIGGTLDFYFVAGPEPKTAIEQYIHIIGMPAMQPYWSFGLHLCRWGYDSLEETKEVTRRMREANIPLETQWNDIDYMLAYYNFELASDASGRFPIEGTKAYIAELHANNQHYIPIIDAAFHKVDPSNATDIYDAYTEGAKQDVWMETAEGTEYVGRVWPGYSVFPDFFKKNTQSWWTELFANFSRNQVDFDGIWLDMNEPSSFCVGPCGSVPGANLSDTDPGIILPGLPENLIVDYPEGYNSSISGPSGNITVNGTLTFNQTRPASSSDLDTRGARRIELLRRGVFTGLGDGDFIDNLEARQFDASPEELTTPPYAIHNGAGPLNEKTIAMNATHPSVIVNGEPLREYSVHNLWGHMEEIATHESLKTIHPNKRPFIVSRSTFAGSGRVTSHWLGDNYSSWFSMWVSLQGILQFQAFGIPMVGADACGFGGNTDEELCNRWMMLAAFSPFYRNHNIKGAISQEPYIWDSVAEASRRAIKIRYSLLPYLYSEMARASLYGTPAIRALWMDFPQDQTLLGVTEQYMFGRGILVTPVLTPNATTVKGTFPGKNSVWRDWYTHEKMDVQPGVNTTISAPLSHINLHILGGNIFLQHAAPAYTTYETAQGPYSLLVALDSSNSATAEVYVDDGISPSSPSSWLTFNATGSSLTGKSTGEYKVEQQLANVTVLGVAKEPSSVTLGGEKVEGFKFDATLGRLVVDGLKGDLNSEWKLEWS